MNRILIYILIIVFSYSGFATTYFVNGINGRDHNDGKTKNKPLKTISRALTFAKGSDEIIIEGRQGNKDIIYYESILLDKGKFSLKITGENNPVIDGSKFTNDSILTITNYCGIYVKSNLINIHGLTVRNFIYSGNDTSGAFGAGIYIEPGSMKNSILNVTIENCNWGVYLEGNSLAMLDNLSIRDIKTSNNGKGGIGISIIPGGSGIENNQIGAEKGNTILTADKYGISFGRKGEVAFADNTIIFRNVIQNCGEAGLILYDIEGIVSIRENTFQSNKTALLIEGVPIDTRVSENIFMGSSGNTEIETTKDYDGYLLFDIWQRNGNKFSVPTYAVVNRDESKEEVIIGKNGGFIRNREDYANNDAGKDNKVKKKE